MSLLVWLPLNGDLTNNGLSDIIIENNNATVIPNGKLGSALSFNGTSNYLMIKNNPLINHIGSDITISGWIYSKSSTVTQTIVCSRTTTGYGLSIFLISGKLRFDFYNNGAQFNTSITYPINEWFHLCFTAEDGMMTLYLNGINVTSRTMTPTNTVVTNFLSIGCSQQNGSGMNNYLNGYLNDIRIYNECLSTKEIKEISKGMILHYPLSDPYNISIKNYFGYLPSNIKLIDTDVFEKYGIRKAYQIFSSTRTGLKYTPLYSSETLIEGETYTLTCYAYASLDSNDDFTFLIQPESRVQSQIKRVTYMNGAAEKGKPYKMYMTFIAKANTNFTLLYMQGYGGSFTTGYQLWGGFQLHKGTEILDYTEDSLSEPIEYDVSGFNNHGFNNSNNKLPLYSLDSPINNGSYLLNDLQSIDITDIAYENMDQGTISLWLKVNSQNGWDHYFGICNTFNWTGTANDFIIIAKHSNDALDPTICIDCCSYIYNFMPNINEWINIVITWDSINYVIKRYVNGVIVDTCDDSVNKRLDTYRQAHRFHKIGNFMNSSDAKYKSNMNVSDLRIYATALTDADIQELYNTRYSVTNTGTLITTSEIIEEVEE